MRIFDKISEEIEVFWNPEFRVGFLFGSIATFLLSCLGFLFLGHILMQSSSEDVIFPKNKNSLTPMELPPKKYCVPANNESIYVDLLQGWDPEIQIPHIMKSFSALKNSLVIHKCTTTHITRFQVKEYESWEITGFHECKNVEEFARRLNGFAYHFYDQTGIIIDPSWADAQGCDNSHLDPDFVVKRWKLK
jgi:hypothetical protein